MNNISKTILFFIIVNSFTGCFNNGKKDPVKKVTDHMKDKNKFELAVNISWGNNSSEIKPRVEEKDIISDHSLQQSHKIYSPVLFKVDKEFNIHIVNLDLKGKDKLVHYSKEGVFVREIDIPSSGKNKDRDIIDFAVDKDFNYYLLEKVKIEENILGYQFRFYKINKEGIVLWEHRGDLNKKECRFDKVEGEFHKVLIDNESNCFLVSNVELLKIGKFDNNDGKFIQAITFENGSNQIFSNDVDKIFRVIYLKDKKRRGLSWLDTKSLQTSIDEADKQFFGSLLYTFGVDDSLNCYVYDFPKISKIAFPGGLVNTQNITGICISISENPIVFTSANIDDKSVLIKGYFMNKKIQEWQLQIPDTFLNRFADNFKIIKVDEENRFYISMQSPKKNTESVLIFSGEGLFIEEMVPSNWLLMESRLQNYQTWKVDGQGKVYLPVVSPEGFNLIRMNF